MIGHTDMGEMKLHARDYLRVLHNRWAVVLAGLFVVFFGAVAITYISPQKYLGRVVAEM